MIYSTASVPVNPEDATPLTHAQVWKGLVLKARDASRLDRRAKQSSRSTGAMPKAASRLCGRLSIKFTKCDTS